MERTVNEKRTGLTVVVDETSVTFHFFCLIPGTYTGDIVRYPLLFAFDPYAFTALELARMTWDLRSELAEVIQRGRLIK